MTYEQRLKATFCTDEWNAYNEPLLGTHHLIGKAFTTPTLRCNNTLRQRLGRLVRKTLSFSKSLDCLHATLALFISDYNASRSCSHYPVPGVKESGGHLPAAHTTEL